MRKIVTSISCLRPIYMAFSPRALRLCFLSTPSQLRTLNLSHQYPEDINTTDISDQQVFTLSIGRPSPSSCLLLNHALGQASAYRPPADHLQRLRIPSQNRTSLHNSQTMYRIPNPRRTRRTSPLGRLTQATPYEPSATCKARRAQQDDLPRTTEGDRRVRRT